MCMGFSPARMSVNQIYILGDHGSQKRALTPWNWSYRQLWAARWMLRIGFRSSGKAVSALNGWVPFLAPVFILLASFFFMLPFSFELFWGQESKAYLSLCLWDRWMSQKHSSWSIDDYKWGKQRGDSSASGLFFSKRSQLISVSPWPGVGSVCSFLFTVFHLPLGLSR